MFAQATTAQIEAAARDFAAKVADLPLQVSPNGYGVRVECTKCHTSWTHDRAYNITALRAHVAGC